MDNYFDKPIYSLYKNKLFVRQNDTFRCAPIAIFNTLKWFDIKKFRNKRVDLSLVSTIEKLCYCTKKGTYLDNFEKVLYTIPNLLIEKIENPGYNLIKHNIQNNKLVLFFFYHYNNISHICPLVDFYNNKIVGINFDEKKPYSYLGFLRLKYFLLKSKSINRSIIWVINHNNI